MITRRLPQVDHHRVAFHAHVEPRLPKLRIHLMLTIPHVKLPTMPRTGNDAAPQFAFAQGTPLVRTDAVESMELTIDIV
jgi:hypothetical protein